MLDSTLLGLVVLLLGFIYVRLCMIYRAVSLRPVAVPAEASKWWADLSRKEALLRQEAATADPELVAAAIALSHHCGHTTAEHVAYTDGTRACQACHDAPPK